MTYAALRQEAGHEPIWIAELLMDYCSLTYGVAPCTASGAVGSECFNTRKTTQDAANYDGGGANLFTYRFAQESVSVPPNLDAMPLLLSVSITPTEITRGRGMGPRGSVTLTFRDAPHDDRGIVDIDKYVDTRTYDPATQGTFWTKWLARNPFYQGRILKLRSGFVTEPWDWANFESRTFFIENISGPSANNIVTVTAKDVLKLADDDRALAPTLSSGVLAFAITDSDTSLTITPDSAGADYPSPPPGTVRIGSEVINFTTTVVGPPVQLTGLTRGVENTVAVAHDADEQVQFCVRYTNSTLDVVLNDLLTTYAGIDSSYITLADWSAEVGLWMPENRINAVITEPTGVRRLIQELTTVFQTDIWWDDVDEQIRLRVLHPERGLPDTVSDASNVLADSFNQRAITVQRRTRVYVYYDYIDPTEPMDEARNFRSAYFFIDSDAESTEEYGDVRVERFYNRWSASEADAVRLAGRTILAAVDTPLSYVWALNVKDDYEVGDVVRLSVRNIRDDTGAVLPTDVLIIGRKESRASNRFDFKAITNGFDGRYAYIGPNALNDYSVESDANKAAYGFIAENAPPQLGGDGPYLII